MNLKALRADPLGYVIRRMGWKHMLDWLPDEWYLRLNFRSVMGRWPNLKNPLTYNEKLQWLKLHDRKPLYTQLVDKHAVRRHVEERIGEEYLIPLVGGPWESFGEIDFDALPEQFVLKCTHDSGGLVICRSKAEMDMEAARRKIDRSMKRNYFWMGREWPYRHVKPRIIAEKYMQDGTTAELRDYKFFCFDGKAKALFIASDRNKPGMETRFDFFDMDFNHLDVRNGHPNADTLPEKPVQFDLMRRLAEMLSAGLPHVRVDMYEVDGQVYFGEITFYHWSGMKPFEPEEWDRIFGSWITLPNDSCGEGKGTGLLPQEQPDNEVGL